MTKKERKFRNFEKLMIVLLFVVIILWALFYGVLGFTSIPNDDMSPRLDGGDICLYDRLDKNPGNNEIVMFEKNDLEYVGRIVARPGDIVNITDEHGLQVNNNFVTENKIYEDTKPYGNLVHYPLILGNDEYFVLIDSRESGEDSRYFGPVKKSELKGVVFAVIRRVNL